MLLEQYLTTPTQLNVISTAECTADHDLQLIRRIACAADTAYQCCSIPLSACYTHHSAHRPTRFGLHYDIQLLTQALSVTLSSVRTHVLKPPLTSHSAMMSTTIIAALAFILAHAHAATAPPLSELYRYMNNLVTTY